MMRTPLCVVSATLAASAVAQDAPAPAPDWSAMRIAGEKAVRDLLLQPKSAQFDWQRGFIRGSWRPYNSRVISGWLTCGAAYAKDKFGYQRGGVFVVVIYDGRAYADMDSRPGGPVSRGCNTMTLPAPQPGMLDSATP